MRGRSAVERGRGMATGSTITGASSISAALAAMGVVALLALSASDLSLSLSLSRLPRNLLPLRILEEGVEGKVVVSLLVWVFGLPEAELAMELPPVLPVGSVTDFERSRF